MAENTVNFYKDEQLDEIDMQEDFNVDEIEDISETELRDLSAFVCSFIKGAPKLTKEENLELVLRAQGGDKKAEELLLRIHGRLVIHFAKKYSFSEVPFEDLFQEGIYGLTVGIHKYDSTKECAFSTYASYWIKCKIRRYITNNSNAVRYPAHIYEKVIKYKKLISQIDNGTLSEMTEEEMAKYLEISVSKLSQIKILALSAASLDKEIVGTDGDITLMDALMAPEQDNPENILLEKDKKEFCLEMLEILNENERDVIKRRMGFYGRRMSLEEIGKLYGVSRERIRQIELRAMKKLTRRFSRQVNAYFQYA